MNERNQQKKTLQPYVLVKINDGSSLKGVQVTGNTAGFCSQSSEGKEKTQL